MSRPAWKVAALVIGALTGCFPLRVAEAQEQAEVGQSIQVQRMQQTRAPQQQAPSNDPTLYPDEETDTGNQVLLQTAPRWDWVDITLDTQYYHTSNAYLRRTNLEATWLLVNSIDAEIDAPPIAVPNGDLYTDLGYQYEWFDYGIGGAGADLSDLDFDSATLYGEAQYALPDNWAVFGNLSYNRLLNDGNGFTEIYKEIIPTVRLEKAWSIRQDLETAVEYSGNYRITDEIANARQGRSCNNRTDEVLYFALTWQVTPQIDIRPYYRFEYSYYPSFYSGASRNDFLHTFGMTVDYSFNSWSSIRVFMDYEILDTDATSIGNYRKLDVGTGISAGIKF
jgi:hypothetical protein